MHPRSHDLTRAVRCKGKQEQAAEWPGPFWVTGLDIGAFRAKAGLAEMCQFRHQGDKAVTSHTVASTSS